MSIDVGGVGGSFVILLLLGVITGLLPGLIIRLIVRIFPKDDPRREELKGELYHIPFLERISWLCQSIEIVCTEGVPARFRKVRERRRNARQLKKFTAPWPDRPFASPAKLSEKEIEKIRRDVPSVPIQPGGDDVAGVPYSGNYDTYLASNTYSGAPYGTVAYGGGAPTPYPTPGGDLPQPPPQ